MIVAKWKQIYSEFQCSECRMKSKTIETKCPFCGAQMSNWEEMLINIFKDKEKYNDRNQEYEDATRLL